MEKLEKMYKLEEEEKNIPENILEEMIIYLYTHGLIIKSKTNGVNHIPIMLTPSPLPKDIYDKIYFYQIAFNKIIIRLSNDQKYLEEILNPIAEKDEFVRKNLEISKKLVNYEHKQKIKLGIFRNDYLFDKVQNFLLFTEYNTIASSMGTFSDRLKKFYSYFSEKYPDIFKKYKEAIIPVESYDNIEKFAQSMFEAIQLGFPNQYKDSIIVFVIQKNETNIFDQCSISDELYNKYKIATKRLTLNEIKKNCVQDESGNLTIDGKLISMFYFRAGYCESDFQDEESWQGRELIELSTAIKVPDINTFLTTFKVFQYELSKPHVMKHYCDNELIINDILRFFGGIYYIRDMNDEAKKELFSKIKSDPTKYIMKPMREGGGNNIYGDKLKELIPEEGNEPGDILNISVIVDKIDSALHESLVLRNEKISVQNSISEFSIYGIVLSNDNIFKINKSASFLVRTKNKDEIEGGIMEGAGAVDLPCLVDAKLDVKLNKQAQITHEEMQKYLDELKAAEEEAKKKAEEEEKKKAEEEEKKKKEEEEKKKEEAEGKNKPEEKKTEEGAADKKPEGGESKEKTEETKSEKKPEGEGAKKVEEVSVEKKPENEEAKKKEEEEAKKKADEESKKKAEEESKKEEEKPKTEEPAKTEG